MAGRSLYGAGNFAGAERLLRQALREDPELALAHGLLSLALYRQHKGLPALDAAKAAIAITPDAFGFRVKTLALMQLGRKDDALEAALAAVAADPMDQRAILLLAMALEDKKKLKEAEAMFRRGVAIGPDPLELRADLGCFLLRRNRLVEAEAEAATLDSASEDQSALLLRGEIAIRRGRAEEARDFALWILSLDATSVGAQQLLAKVRASQSRLLGFWWRYSMFMAARRPLFRWFVVIPSAGLLLIIAPWAMIPFVIYLRICERKFAAMLKTQRETVTLKSSF